MNEDALWAEVSEIAFSFKWPLDDILDLEHALRRRFLTHIAQLHGA